MSEKKITTIKNLLFDNNIFTIETTHGNFSCMIIKGSVDCIIMDNNNKILPLSCLDIGNNIRLILKNNTIKKIYINTNYTILSDSE